MTIPVSSAVPTADQALHVVSEMEDRLDAGCPRQQCVLLMLFERPVVLRDVHRQAEIFLVPGRQRSRDWMAERPAQSQRSLVREGCRLIPAFWLGMALLLVGRPYRLCHRLQCQDAHALFLRTLQNLWAEVRLR